MTPKEKAQELSDEMWNTISDGTLDTSQCNAMAKECALIAVDEILKIAETSTQHRDWMQVKQEIQNL